MVPVSRFMLTGKKYMNIYRNLINLLKKGLLLRLFKGQSFLIQERTREEVVELAKVIFQSFQAYF